MLGGGNFYRRRALEKNHKQVSNPSIHYLPLIQDRISRRRVKQGCSRTPSAPLTQAVEPPLGEPQTLPGLMGYVIHPEGFSGRYGGALPLDFTHKVS